MPRISRAGVPRVSRCIYHFCIRCRIDKCKVGCSAKVAVRRLQCGGCVRRMQCKGSSSKVCLRVQFAVLKFRVSLSFPPHGFPTIFCNHGYHSEDVFSKACVGKISFKIRFKMCFLVYFLFFKHRTEYFPIRSSIICPLFLLNVHFFCSCFHL